MATIGEKAKYVRSKNAGPFWVTMDIFFDDPAAYQAAKTTPGLEAQALSHRLNTPEHLVKRFFLDDLMVVKISIPRPTVQGGPGERDMHAGQQYIELLDIEL